MKYKLIIALDFDNEKQALSLVEKLSPDICALKVGSEMYTRLGPSFVRALVNRKFKVFLDLKFHDIPTTVARSCAVASELGIWMVNIHASGGLAMMEAARGAVDQFGDDKPLLIAVSVLTSMKSEDLRAQGITKTLEEHVCYLSRLAFEANLDGMVSSALEVPLIKKACGATFLTVTPGIRLPKHNLNDQSRVITPKQALALGSDYLVVGRPVTQAEDPMLAITELFADV
ncbi:MAG: orotidine-5'-phosphate decarboxylase [Legionellaceae bacterium]|nr:orotidine-5'-phosphate decarboxylase [Legionellaceae bacterium]